MSEILRLREEGLEWRALEGELVALDGARSRYLSANRAGAVVWDALSRGATRDELAALIIERFDVDRETAALDLESFLDVLRREDLLAGD